MLECRLVLRRFRRARPIGAENRMGRSVMEYTPEQRRHVQEGFAAALDRLEAEGREPDRWEEECLAYAVAAMACGMYALAATEIDVFATNGKGRSPEADASFESPPPRFTIELFRRGLMQVRAFGD